MTGRESPSGTNTPSGSTLTSPVATAATATTATTTTTTTTSAAAKTRRSGSVVIADPIAIGNHPYKPNVGNHDLLIKLARMVSGRLGLNNENELLVYPQYESDRYTELKGIKSESQSSMPPSPMSSSISYAPVAFSYQPHKQFPPPFGMTPKVVNDEYQRGLYPRTPVALGTSVIPSPLLESNAMHALVLIMRASRLNIELYDFLENADANVMDAFVDLVAATIIAVRQGNSGEFPRRHLNDTGARIHELLAMFTTLILGTDRKFHFGCPELENRWDPVADGFAFGYGY